MHLIEPNNAIKGDTCAETDVRPSKKQRSQSECHVVHFVVLRESSEDVAGEELTDGRLQLPRAKLPKHIENSELWEVPELDMLMEKELGIHGYVVRELDNGSKTKIDVGPTPGENIEDHLLVLAETEKDAFVLQEPLKWIPKDIATNGRWMDTNGEEGSDYVGTRIEDLFEETREERSPEEELAPWQMMGWIKQITSWTRGMLQEKNMVMEGRLKRRHIDDRSSVMSCNVRIRAERESEKRESCEVLFIKTYFGVTGQGQRTVTARSVLGDIVPEVLYFCKEEGIMVQRDGGTLTSETWDQEAVINTILKMQKLSMDRISELEKGGLIVADSEWVESHVEWILKHKVLDMVYEDNNVDGGRKMLDKVRSKIGVMQGACHEITGLGLKNTIVHGDMHMPNVGSPIDREEKIYRFFDWEDSFIGNPLHDFRSLLYPVSGYSIDVVAGLRQIYDHYNPSATFEYMSSKICLTGIVSTLIEIYILILRYEVVGKSDACIQNILVENITNAIYDLHGLGEERLPNWGDEP